MFYCQLPGASNGGAAVKKHHKAGSYKLYAELFTGMYVWTLQGKKALDGVLKKISWSEYLSWVVFKTVHELFTILSIELNVIKE